jgi:hypothetical protein
MNVGPKGSTRSQTTARVVPLLALALLGVGLSGCQPAAETARIPDREILARTIAGLEAEGKPGTVEHTKSTTILASSEQTTTVRAEEWLEANGQRSRVDATETTGTIGVPGNTETTMTTLRNRGVYVEVKDGKARLTRSAGSGSGTQRRHAVRAAVFNNCATCHSTHFADEITASALATVTTALIEEARWSDERHLPALALRRGARVLEETRTVDGEDAYVIQRVLKSPEDTDTVGGANARDEQSTDVTFTVFARTDDFEVVRWESESEIATATWTLDSRETLPPGEVSPAMFLGPDGESPLSPTAVLVRTISTLREKPRPGTVAHTVIKRGSTAADDSNPETHEERTVTDETWTTADGRLSRTRRRVTTANTGEEASATDSIVYHADNRSSEIVSADGKKKVLEHPDAENQGFNHTFEELLSPLCQDCHSTHYVDGTYQLIPGALGKWTKGKSNDELLVRILESSDATITSSRPGYYSIMVDQPEYDRSLEFIVRAKDFAVTEWYLNQGESQRNWVLKKSETLPLGSLPASFFDSPVPLKKWPVTAEE